MKNVSVICLNSFEIGRQKLYTNGLFPRPIKSARPSAGPSQTVVFLALNTWGGYFGANINVEGEEWGDTRLCKMEQFYCS